MLTQKQSEAIAKQTVLHASHITDFQRIFDYGEVRLYNDTAGKLVNPSDKMRRSDDFLAAAYAHSIARYAESGDDCIDKYGHAIELKLAYIKSKRLQIGVSGQAIVTKANNSFLHSVNAKFRVYEGTDKNHHNKDTAFILISEDHNCFITGFVMSGDLVTKYVHSDTRNTVQRDVSLSTFIKHGYEIGSMVPHIGWAEYYTALEQFLMAKEQRITGKKADEAIAKWISFADTNNLKTL